MKVINLADVSKHIGEDLGASEWVLIDQDRVNKFADATGDHQWIHIDVERAKRELPTQGTIAHGYLTLSLIPFLASKISRIDGVTRGINYGSNKVRFTNMVPVGSRVRARSRAGLITAAPAPTPTPARGARRRGRSGGARRAWGWRRAADIGDDLQVVTGDTIPAVTFKMS